MRSRSGLSGTIGGHGARRAGHGDWLTAARVPAVPTHLEVEMGANQSDNDEQGSRRERSILDEGGIDVDERAGRSLGIDPYEVPDEATRQQIEAERAERLAPENRPGGAEVDNTEREFDHERGQFTDSEGYDESEPARFSDPEDPNNR